MITINGWVKICDYNKRLDKGKYVITISGWIKIQRIKTVNYERSQERTIYGSIHFYVTHTNIHSYAHTYLHQIYSKVPLGYLLELFHRGPCRLERVVLAARASDRSRRPLTRMGYPRPLAHSQALLPSSEFTSKFKEGGTQTYISTNF